MDPTSDHALLCFASQLNTFVCMFAYLYQFDLIR